MDKRLGLFLVAFVLLAAALPISVNAEPTRAMSAEIEEVHVDGPAAEGGEYASGTHQVTVNYNNGPIVGVSNPVTVSYPLYGGIQRHEENSPAFVYGPSLWQHKNTSTEGTITPDPAPSSSGYVARSETVGHSASITFTGNWIGVGFLTDKYGGKVDVLVDGSPADQVDLYSEADPWLARLRDRVLAGSRTD